MTWSFTVSGDTKEDALASFEAMAANQSSNGCPVATVVRSAKLLSAPFADEARMSITCHGYLDGAGSGNIAISINF